MSAQVVESVGVSSSVSLSAGGWRTVLSACLVSVGRDSTLPTLMAVEVACDGAQLVATSTDRYRLTQATVVVDVDCQAVLVEPFTVVLPTDLVKRMLVLVKGVPARSAGVLPFTLSVEPSAIGGVRDRVVSFGSGDGRVSGMAFTDGEYPRVGSIVDGAREGKAGVVDGRLEIGFNAKYLADLGRMPTERHNGTVRMSFGDPTRPALAEWSVDGVDLAYLLMPVRLGS